MIKCVNLLFENSPF